MIEAVWQALVYTPWWVYLIFLLLIRIGIQAMKPREVAFWKVILIPFIFMGLSIHSLFFNFRMSGPVLGVSVVGFMVGNILGYWITGRKDIYYNHNSRAFYISGAVDTLVLLVLVFLTKYYFGYTIAIDPDKMHNTIFEYSMLGSSMMISGIFAGRLMAVLKKSFWPKKKCKFPTKARQKIV